MLPKLRAASVVKKTQDPTPPALKVLRFFQNCEGVDGTRWLRKPVELWLGRAAVGGFVPTLSNPKCAMWDSGKSPHLLENLRSNRTDN